MKSPLSIILNYKMDIFISIFLLLSRAQKKCQPLNETNVSLAQD